MPILTAQKVAPIHTQRAFLCAAVFCLVAVQPAKTQDAAWGDLFAQIRHNKQLVTASGAITWQLWPLAKARWTATNAITAEMDSQLGQDTQFIRALYLVLGITKDPTTIEWIENRLQNSPTDRRLIYRFWLARWRDSGFGEYCARKYLAYKWIKRDDVDRWRPLFIRLADKATTHEERMAALRAMAASFHDEKATEYFSGLEASSKEDEFWLVEKYLHDHGRPLNALRLREQIEALMKSPGGQDDISVYSCLLRHETFVPALIDMLDGKSRQDALRSLRLITHVTDLQTKQDWDGWWKLHSTETHEEWVRCAAKQLDVLVSTDPASAASSLIDADYWSEPGALPFIRRWVKVGAMRHAVAYWLITSYSEHYRQEFVAVAEELLRSGTSGLNEDDKLLLEELDLYPGQSRTWESWWQR